MPSTTLDANRIKFLADKIHQVTEDEWTDNIMGALVLVLADILDDAEELTLHKKLQLVDGLAQAAKDALRRVHRDA